MENPCGPASLIDTSEFMQIRLVLSFLVLLGIAACGDADQKQAVMPKTLQPSPLAGMAAMGQLASDPFSQMSLAFDGNPLPSEIQPKLDQVLTMYNVELNNANRGLAGRTLTELRKEQGHSEMSILDRMIQAPTNGEKLEDAARRVSTAMNQ
jgi:hypothetical protein